MAQHITVGGLGATVVGTPEHVADEFERWVAEADIDGFNIVGVSEKRFVDEDAYLIQAYAHKPGTFEQVIELLLPELRKRGLFWDDYAVQGGTYRENIYKREGQSGLLPDHPAAGYRWKAE